MALGGARPTALRQHNRDGLTGNERRFVERTTWLAFNDDGAPVIAKLLSIRCDFFLDQRLQSCIAAKQLLDDRFLGRELILLPAYLEFLEFGKIAQTQVQDGVRLSLAQRETTHQLAAWLVVLTNDGNDFINIKLSAEQTLQHVQALIDLFQAELEPTYDGIPTKTQPLL